MRPNAKVWRVLSLLFLFALVLPGFSGSPASAAGSPAKVKPQKTGIYDFRGQQFSTSATTDTACPQNTRVADQTDSDDVRANQDRSCQPQNETSIAVNPRNSQNLVAGANDYRLGFGSSGFYASQDGGRTWQDGILPFPSLPNGDNLDGGGDPAIAFDRAGIAYYADINFNRTDDTNGVFTRRSTNGGRTWTRPCVPIAGASPTDDVAVCGGFGDPRQPGDGVVTFQFDNDTTANGSVDFNDKEYIAVGPRPTGVAPTCFAPETKRPVACAAGTVGVDRIYVTYTRFEAAAPFGSPIVVSFSDDQARSWSPPRAISGSAPFCAFGGVAGDPTRCNFNQFSVPTVHPTTGVLYVAFQNFNTEEENQYVVVRSRDGGRTFTAPRFVGSVFDFNYPRSGVNSGQPGDPRNRPDCATRGQGNFRAVLTNNCFRVNSGGNIVVDKRTGAFADDLYVVISDNRNGTAAKSNTDIFLFKSTNGGDNWTNPTRVNNDVSRLVGSRDDRTNTQVTGNDQWFPWVDINRSGDLNVVFFDRRLDRNSVNHEYGSGSTPVSRQFPGNYLTWFWGAQCRVGVTDNQQTSTGGGSCVADARVLPQPTAPVNPGPGPVPGQNQTRFPFRNFDISDVPSNMDYAFRAGIFIGDYNNVAVTGTRAHGFWTDARNGRSSRNQPGRNPLCEQSDVYYDSFAANGAASDAFASASDSRFLRFECR